MYRHRFSHQKAQSIDNDLVVGVPFVHVRVTSGQGGSLTDRPGSRVDGLLFLPGDASGMLREL